MALIRLLFFCSFCSLLFGAELVGYYSSWAHYRADKASCPPESLEPVLPILSRINYAFLLFNYQQEAKPYGVSGDFALHFADHRDKDILMRLVALKKKAPHLKICATIGGWHFNDPNHAYGEKTFSFFSEVITDKLKRSKLIESMVFFAKEFQIDGYDIDWEYPGAPSRGGSGSDYEAFADFLKVASERFSRESPKLLLTLAIPAKAPWKFASSGAVIEGDGMSYFRWLSSLSPYCDAFHLMAYNYIDLLRKTEENAPLYPPIPGGACVQKSVNDYLLAGMPKNKLVVGVGAYGRIFEDVDFKSSFGPGIPFKAQGSKICSYHDIAEGFVSKRWVKSAINPETQTAYAWHPEKGAWVTFDSPESIFLKGQWIRARGLSGGLIYPLDGDHQTKGDFPLTRAFAKGLNR